MFPMHTQVTNSYAPAGLPPSRCACLDEGGWQLCRQALLPLPWVGIRPAGLPFTTLRRPIPAKKGTLHPCISLWAADQVGAICRAPGPPPPDTLHHLGHKNMSICRLVLLFLSPFDYGNRTLSCISAGMLPWSRKDEGHQELRRSEGRLPRSHQD